jgi:hypothetical protein
MRVMSAAEGFHWARAAHLCGHHDDLSAYFDPILESHCDEHKI